MRGFRKSGRVCCLVETRRNLCEGLPRADTSNSRQQFSSHWPSTVAMRARTRTVAVDRGWFAGDHTEQPAKIPNQFTPRFRRNSQSLKQAAKLFWRGSRFVQSLLTCGPVEKRQIVSCRHRQESLVAAASPRLMNTRASLPRSLLQIHRSQMTTSSWSLLPCDRPDEGAFATPKLFDRSSLALF